MHTIQEIEARLSEIRTLLENPDADLAALEEEVRTLNAERDQLRAQAQEAEQRRARIAQGLGTVVESHEAEEPPTDVRSTDRYVEAYARYLRTGDDREARSLLTVNAPANGTLPVPTILQEYIETAWESNEILSRVSRTDIRGNLRVPFELSADDAIVHAEGSGAVAEEELTFGLVELRPETVKKWVSFSDEVEAMRGEEFLRYVYDEITYRVLRKLADECLDDITDAPAASTASAIGVPSVTLAPSVVAIPTAAANLSEDARNIVVIMNRLTEVAFMEAYAAGSFAVDPFAGVTKVYSSHLPAYSAATAGKVYAIVGDLAGERVNYPEGDDVTIKYDDVTRKKEDIIEILGKQYAAHGVTKLGHFVNLKKPA
jgi:HK97 family phage major capsid protein